MIFSTVASLRSSWPRITWYFAALPFCSRKPKATPVRRPRTSWSADSNMTPPLLPEQHQGGRHGDGEGQRHEHPALRRELQGAADAVAAGAAARDPRAKDHQRPAQEREREPFGGA